MQLRIPEDFYRIIPDGAILDEVQHASEFIEREEATQITCYFFTDEENLSADEKLDLVMIVNG